ncbi:MAG TPA: N-acetylmuramoyl-L-alanine amidase [Pyrinomonadaceae bacterium]|jgi:hypothetical protein
MRPAAETTLRQSKVVERYAHFFDRPEVRLRFLNHTLTLQRAAAERLDLWLERFPAVKRSRLFERHYERLLDLLLYRLIVQEINKYLPASAGARLRLLRQHKAPRAARVYFGFYQARHVFHAAAVLFLLLTLCGVYTASAWSVRRVNGYLARRYGKTIQTPVGVAYAQPAPTALPDYKPEKVWQVERRDDYERYSNGGRISTEYETDNHPRAFYRLPHAAAGAPLDNASAQPLGELRREPVGIVYHTSESDLVEFTADNSESIEAHTRGLLAYVQRNRSYNYLIDRFGQIYRVVRDDQAANHAGHSVWADRDGVYVGLNESFIGVCFETRTDAHEEERLTEAQLVAGRLLTQILRSRYQLDDADCTVHGLVSVNPDNMRICYHHDWARNFPFAALGLSDKYQVAPASVAEFGFTYDDDVIAQIGGALWPGVLTAAAEFDRRAAAARLAPDALRRQLRERYRQQLNLARGARTAAPADDERASAQTSAPAAAPHPAAPGTE